MTHNVLPLEVTDSVKHSYFHSTCSSLSDPTSVYFIHFERLVLLPKSKRVPYTLNLFLSLLPLLPGFN